VVCYFIQFSIKNAQIMRDQAVIRASRDIRCLAEHNGGRTGRHVKTYHFLGKNVPLFGKVLRTLQGRKKTPPS